MNKPDPLVPADADLRDFPFMPLDVVRLRDSDLAGHPDGEVFRCAVLSWCVAWHQQPAGSLPDDDAALARLLGYGRDVKGFQRIKTAGGMRGWESHSDGRLYHRTVAEKANEAWARRMESEERREKWRKKKEAQRAAVSMDAPSVSPEKPAERPKGQVEMSPGTNADSPPGNAPDRTGQEKTGQNSKYSVPDGTGTADAAPPDLPPLESNSDLLDIPLGLLRPPNGDWGVLLFRQGLNWLAATVGKPPAKLRPQLGRWRKVAGDDDQRLFGLLIAAQRDRVADPVAWIEAALLERAADGARPGAYVPDDDAVKRYAGVTA